MPRYEFVEGASSKFWEIELSGNAFSTTYGKIGGKGKTTQKEFGDAAEAQKQYDKAIASKTKKGYVLAGGEGGGAAAGAKTAFRLGDLEQLNSQPFEFSETFMGQRIELYEPEEGLKNAGRVAWRLEGEAEPFEDFVEQRLQPFLADKNAAKVKALVLGEYDEELFEPGPCEQLVKALVEAAPKLPGLRALFLCDMHAEQLEISWQHTTDMAPLLAAYPDLEHLRVRGDPGACPGNLKHDKLRSLQFEGSNLSRELVHQVGRAELPALEHLEVWLGPEGDYAAAKEIADYVPIFSGKLFPNLKTLSLRNSEMTDQLAAAIADAPLLERLETLDLSLGNLTDEGAAALLASPNTAKLKTLMIHCNSVSSDRMKELKALGIDVKSSNDDERYDPIGE